MECSVVIHDDGVLGEETLACSLPEHEGTEHLNPKPRMWWDSETKVRVPAARMAELNRIYWT